MSEGTKPSSDPDGTKAIESSSDSAGDIHLLMFNGSIILVFNIGIIMLMLRTKDLHVSHSKEKNVFKLTQQGMAIFLC